MRSWNQSYRWMHQKRSMDATLTQRSWSAPHTPTPIYNDNQATIIWCKTTSTKGMRHYNIRENAVCKAIKKHKEVSVHHIGGKTNPSDLLTKEHKSPDIFRSLRDSFMSRRSSGGCLHVHSSTLGMRMSHKKYVTDDHELSLAMAASFTIPMTPGSNSL